MQQLSIGRSSLNWAQLASLVALLLLGACSSSQTWHAKDLSGLMPDLEFTLHDEQGKAVTAADFHGIKLMYFGFTHCPDICPATLAKLSAALHHLAAVDRNKVNVLFVSVDPARDTPALLARYTRSFGPEFIGLTGTRKQLQALTKRYRSTFAYGDKDASGNYEVTHSSAVYVFDADNQVRLLVLSDASVTDIAADLNQLIHESD